MLRLAFSLFSSFSVPGEGRTGLYACRAFVCLFCICFFLLPFLIVPLPDCSFNVKIRIDKNCFASRLNTIQSLSISMNCS